MDPRYLTLINILDKIRKDAPRIDSFSRFHSKKQIDIEFSRGQAFIHLFLFAKFGIESFKERDKYICDGPVDGGLDAYYISQADKTIYLVQSKFKNTASNFHGETISSSDLIKMELSRILEGEKRDSNGVNYNRKIRLFQSELNELTKKQVFENKVVFLANLKELNDFQIRKLTEKLDYEVYDFERSYLELVKPVCSGTYYDPDKIIIELDLSGKSTPQLSQSIKTSHGKAEITIYFVPTKEIGRVMTKYKNAILRFNPRNYLGLSKNPVNPEIRKSISSLSTNDFALLNNGITILAEDREFTDRSGRKNVGRLTLTNPQIINGGQTAYTLSDIYEKEYKANQKIFDGKEVLVRVVKLLESKKKAEELRHGFINAISTATNKQTAVKDADRHSSNPVLINIQNDVFRKYGHLVELKQGEFYDGLDKKFIDKDIIIDRTIMIRAYKAFCGLPSPARSQGESRIFEDDFFRTSFSEDNFNNNLSSEIFFAYKVHRYLVALEKKKSGDYGNALRYGKYAVVYATSLSVNTKFKSRIASVSLKDIEDYITGQVSRTLGMWKKFEEDIQTSRNNKKYFDPKQDLTDFDNYYKGSTLSADLERFFSK